MEVGPGEGDLHEPSNHPTVLLRQRRGILDNAAKRGVGPLKNVSGSLDDAARLARNRPYGPINNVFRRLPKSLQDVLALVEIIAQMCLPWPSYPPCRI